MVVVLGWYWWWYCGNLTYFPRRRKQGTSWNSPNVYCPKTLRSVLVPTLSSPMYGFQSLILPIVPLPTFRFPSSDLYSGTVLVHSSCQNVSDSGIHQISVSKVTGQSVVLVWRFRLNFTSKRWHSGVLQRPSFGRQSLLPVPSREEKGVDTERRRGLTVGGKTGEVPISLFFSYFIPSVLQDKTDHVPLGRDDKRLYRL